MKFPGKYIGSKGYHCYVYINWDRIKGRFLAGNGGWQLDVDPAVYAAFAKSMCNGVIVQVKLWRTLSDGYVDRINMTHLISPWSVTRIDLM